jgi:hypothetical protein
MVGRFCHQCGQEDRRSRRLDLRRIAHDFVERLLDLDSSVVRTFIGLTVRPGLLSREYVAGRRTRYTNPIGYLGLACVGSVLFYRLGRLATRSSLDPIDAVSEDWALPISIALSVPMASFLRKLFAKSGYNYAENFVFILYLVAQIAWLEAIVVGPVAAWQSVAEWATVVVLLVALAYMTWGAMQFYRESAGRSLLRVAAGSLGCLAIVVVIRLVLIPFWPLEE